MNLKKREKKQCAPRAVQHYLEYLLLKWLLATLRHSRRKTLTYRIRRLGAVAYCLAAKDRRRAIEQLRTHTRATPAQARAIVRGMFNHLVTSISELALHHQGDPVAPAVRFSPGAKETIDNALAEKRGVLYVTGHLGNFELMATTLSHWGYPIHTVVRRTRNPYIHQLIHRSRINAGITTIDRNAPGAATGMRRALRKNGVLGMLIDQDTNVPNLFVPFFGESAATPQGAAKLAAKCACPVVVGTIQRTRTGAHQIKITRIAMTGDLINDTALFNQALESRIRERISQWPWFHKRWKTKQVAVQ